VSKPFVYALIAKVVGYQRARDLLGVNATGLPFDSIMAVELNENRTMNPMVNAGAMATTSLAPGRTGDEQWEFVHQGLSLFAGRPLTLDRDVYESESASNLRNQGVAHLLYGYGRLFTDPITTVDLYTRQCSLLVTVEDLAVMGATLAGGGTNPRTGDRVVSPGVAKRTLAVMSTAGLYEHSGNWLYDVGLPG
jgi:glutaminase